MKGKRKMTDKERILTKIIRNIALDKDDVILSPSYDYTFHKGDLVIAISGKISDFTVAWVEDIADNHLVLREIGSKRLCSYYNEAFCKINTENLGYEILEETEYKTYQKILKAFSLYANIKFAGCEFDGNKCIVKARKIFENDVIFTFEFEFNSRTSIKKIEQCLIVAAEQYKNNAD